MVKERKEEGNNAYREDFEEENEIRESEPEEEEETGFSFRGFCEETASLLITAYLFIVFCLYPFYLKDGYTDVGKEKFNFYKVMTIGGFGLIIPLVLLCIFFRIRDRYGNKGGETEAFRKIRFSVTDWAVGAYGVSVVVSYLCSEFKEMALWGERGWNMGLLTQIAFVISYFLVAHFWEYEEKLLLVFMGAATVVFTLGVLNRFSIFPIQVQGANNGCLSTLGNINWYCGFWAVLFPVGFIMYWCGEEIWIRALALLCTMIGIATGVSQGSNSAFPVFAGLYIFTFCLSLNSRKKIRRFCELVILFFATCQGLRLWRVLRPEAFDFYEGTLSDRITISRATLFMLLAMCVVYLLVCLAGRKKATDGKTYKMIRQIAILAVVVIIGVYIFLLILNTRVEGGIRFMGKLSALVFSSEWGSARGATWSAGAEIYRNMHGWKKFIGVGPDCFAMYLYTLPDLAKTVIKQFDGARLTNAHNEWLNMLVNQGILGAAAYLGFFLSAFARFWKRREGNPRMTAGMMAVAAYGANQFFSFGQVVATPLIFLVIAVCEKECRRIDREKERLHG